MSAVQIKRGPKGYVVKAYFGNLPAALCAADRVLSVNEAAYAPVAQHATVVADPATVKLALALEMAESDDMPAHDGRLNPPSQDEE